MTMLPFLLLSGLINIPFFIFNIILSSKKGKRQDVIIILSLIPVCTIMISLWLMSLTDIELIEEIDEIKLKLQIK
jgi:hypothetical protein